MSDELTPPKPTIGDDAHAAGRAAASVLIPAGGHLVDAVFGKPLEKRLNAWRDTIAETVRDLLDREELTVESLQDDPQFIDIVMYASRAAAYTSSDEKRQALANAIYNAGVKRGPDEVERLVFIRLIDELTEWHIKILFYTSKRLPRSQRAEVLTEFEEPWRSALNTSWVKGLEILYSAIESRRDFLLQTRKELIAHGLLEEAEEKSLLGPSKPKQNSVSAHIFLDDRDKDINRTLITDRGKALLAFITRSEDEPVDT